MKRLFAATVAALFLLAPAFAEDAIAPERLTLAKEMIQVSGADKLMGSPETMADLMVEQVKKSVPGIDDAAVAEIRKITTEEWAAAAPGMLEETARLYARHFSEAEMRDMIAFYKSPTGRRLVAELPALMRESVQMSSKLSTNIVKRFVAYMQERASKEQKHQ